MKWEEIKQLALAAKQLKTIELLAKALRLHNGCVAECARELDMREKVLRDQIKKSKTLQSFVDKSELSSKTKQPHWPQHRRKR